MDKKKKCFVRSMRSLALELLEVIVWPSRRVARRSARTMSLNVIDLVWALGRRGRLGEKVWDIMGRVEVDGFNKRSHALHLLIWKTLTVLYLLRPWISLQAGVNYCSSAPCPAGCNETEVACGSSDGVEFCAPKELCLEPKETIWSAGRMIVQEWTWWAYPWCAITVSSVVCTKSMFTVIVTRSMIASKTGAISCNININILCTEPFNKLIIPTTTPKLKHFPQARSMAALWIAPNRCRLHRDGLWEGWHPTCLIAACDVLETFHCWMVQTKPQRSWKPCWGMPVTPRRNAKTARAWIGAQLKHGCKEYQREVIEKKLVTIYS